MATSWRLHVHLWTACISVHKSGNLVFDVLSFADYVYHFLSLHSTVTGDTILFRCQKNPDFTIFKTRLLISFSSVRKSLMRLMIIKSINLTIDFAFFSLRIFVICYFNLYPILKILIFGARFCDRLTILWKSDDNFRSFPSKFGSREALI